MDELPFKSAGELAGLIRKRKVSSVELLDLYLARIEQHNTAVNAVVTLDAERARARARSLDQQLARGQVQGPLHGLPMTIKDAYETEGIRSTGGAVALSSHVPARNALAVQRLIDAGALVFGKTNVPAHSADTQTYNEIFGTTNNPHDPSRTPGGSSGGAAVALACGFAALELGSDIGGSIRTPAGWTGVYGHKPSWGLVPQRGHIPGPPGSLASVDLSVCGPLARSAADLALALDLLAGPDQAHAKAYRLQLPPPRRDSLQAYRVAAWIDDASFPVDREVAQVLQNAISALRGAGVALDLGARPDLTLSQIFDNYLSLLNPIMVMGMPPAVTDMLAQVAATPPKDGEDAMLGLARKAMARHLDWLRANERRARYGARWAAFFERFDVLLCPVTMVAAIPHDHEGSPWTRRITVDGASRPYMDLLGWIAGATAYHLPATAAPIGRTASGLPVGLQIIGPYLEDHTPIDFARRLAEIIGGFQPPTRY